MSSFLQLVRYGVVGVASNGASYLIYLLITTLGLEAKLAMTLVYLVGASIGFVGNRKWTFDHNGAATSAALRYVLAHTFGYLLNLTILYVFVDIYGYPHQWVQAVAIIVVAGFLFTIFKFMVFNDSKSVSKK